MYSFILVSVIVKVGLNDNPSFFYVKDWKIVIPKFLNSEWRWSLRDKLNSNKFENKHAYDLEGMIPLKPRPNLTGFWQHS